MDKNLESDGELPNRGTPSILALEKAFKELDLTGKVSQSTNEPPKFKEEDIIQTNIYNTLYLIEKVQHNAFGQVEGYKVVVFGPDGYSVLPRHGGYPVGITYISVEDAKKYKKVGNSRVTIINTEKNSSI